MKLGLLGDRRTVHATAMQDDAAPAPTPADNIGRRHGRRRYRAFTTLPAAPVARPRNGVILEDFAKQGSAASDSGSSIPRSSTRERAAPA